MWLDNASDIDILFYEPYARIIADIAKNEQYNPLTVGVFGLWGAGKSTLLKLIGEKLKSQAIIRAYGCSLPVIKKNYVDRFDFTPEQREEELDWFGNLIRMM